MTIKKLMTIINPHVFSLIEVFFNRMPIAPPGLVQLNFIHNLF